LGDFEIANHQITQFSLAAAARAAAAHAPIAASVPRHDRAADVARGSIAKIDDVTQSVSGVHASGFQLPASG
jgi:hypothetical protein